MLQREPRSLSYLEDVPVADLRILRDQITEVLWSADGAAMGRLAAAAKLLPNRVSATMSERAFGPVLSAQLAGRLEPSRAIDVAAKLPTDFLADVAIELDPRRTNQVIAGIPAGRIGEITAELIRRGEWVTMGQFVGHLEDDAIRATLDEMDNAQLLRIGFVLENKEQLDHLVALLPDERMNGIIAAAADEGLWIEALDLLSHLSPTHRRRILDSAMAMGAATLQDIVTAVVEHGLWDEVREIAEGDPALQAKLDERAAPL
ncbi:MAG: hypothetical protein ABI323_11900 [Solirubrobacteraceae bacterium]